MLRKRKERKRGKERKEKEILRKFLWLLRYQRLPDLNIDFL